MRWGKYGESKVTGYKEKSMRWGKYGESKVTRYKEKSTIWGKYGESKVTRYKEKSLRGGKMLRFMHGEKWDCNLGMGKKTGNKGVVKGNVRQSNLRGMQTG